MLSRASALRSALAPVPRPFALTQIATFKWKPPKTPGHAPNFHRSNAAKKGLFHGKDVRFGSSISHSHHKTNRKWKPNVQNKRLWSDSLDEWIRFKITAAAIKAVDNYGGIDNYMMRLDERLVQDSNYLIKVRGLIATALYHKGELNPGMAKRLGYDKVPPAKLEGLAFPRKINERKGDYRRGPLAKFQGLGEHPAVPPKKSTGEQADLHELPLMEAAAAEGAQ